MDKQKRKELLMQRYKDKQEIANAKSKLKETLTKIQKEIQKSRIKQRQLTTELRSEEAKLKFEDRKERQKHKADILKQKKIIQENKKLLIEKRNAIKEEMKLKKINTKNSTIEIQKELRQELNAIKTEIRDERFRQREKLGEAKSQFAERKIDLNKKITQMKSENAIYYARAKESLSDKEKEILELKRKLMAKQNEVLMKFKSKKAAKLETSRIEKEELRKHRLKAQKEFREELLRLKENRLLSKDQLNQKVNVLKAEEAKAFEAGVSKELEQSKEALALKAKEDKETLKVQEDILKKANKDKYVPEEEYKDSAFIFNDEYEGVDNIEIEPLVRGKVIGEVGRSGLKIFEKYDGASSKLNIDTIKLPEEEMANIKEMIELKENNMLTKIIEFAKYIGFILDEEIDLEKAKTTVIATVANILQGKILQIFNGYLKLHKVNGYNFIKYYKHLPGTQFAVVSLPDKKTYQKLEEMMAKKLEAKLIIQISNNLAIKQEGDEIIVLHDLPFLR